MEYLDENNFLRSSDYWLAKEICTKRKNGRFRKIPSILLLKHRTILGKQKDRPIQHHPLVVL